MLEQGEDLLKHGRHGKPKMHYFRLIDSYTRLSWRSAKGGQRTVSLRHVLQVCRQFWACLCSTALEGEAQQSSVTSQCRTDSAVITREGNDSQRVLQA